MGTFNEKQQINIKHLLNQILSRTSGNMHVCGRKPPAKWLKVSWHEMVVVQSHPNSLVYILYG